jgi:hypothetical protein
VERCICGLSCRPEGLTAGFTSDYLYDNAFVDAFLNKKKEKYPFRILSLENKKKGKYPFSFRRNPDTFFRKQKEGKISFFLFVEIIALLLGGGQFAPLSCQI